MHHDSLEGEGCQTTTALTYGMLICSSQKHRSHTHTHARTVTPLSEKGTSPATMRWARPSTMAVCGGKVLVDVQHLDGVWCMADEGAWGRG